MPPGNLMAQVVETQQALQNMEANLYPDLFGILKQILLTLEELAPAKREWTQAIANMADLERRTQQAIILLQRRIEKLEKALAPKPPAPPTRLCSEVDENATDQTLAEAQKAAMARLSTAHPTWWLNLPVDNRVLRDAVKKWGNGRQMTKAIEEMAELTAAILHHDDKKANLGEVLGEAADVMIMLLQLRLIYGAEGFDRVLRLKMEALEKRVQA